MNHPAYCFALVSLLQGTALSQQGNLTRGQSEPLERYLGPDGTLNTPPGFAGSLDPRGWRMTTSGADGAPRFVQVTTTVPEDSLWDDQFCWDPLNGDVNALAVIGTDVYVGGDFTQAGNTPYGYVAKWNGRSWSALGSGVNDIVYALTVIGTDVYVGGMFTTADGAPANHVARWSSTSWSALGLGTNGTVFCLTTRGSNLYVGGSFSAAGGLAANNIARWDGSNWSARGCRCE